MAYIFLLVIKLDRSQKRHVTESIYQNLNPFSFTTEVHLSLSVAASNFYIKEAIDRTVDTTSTPSIRILFDLIRFRS